MKEIIKKLELYIYSYNIEICQFIKNNLPHNVRYKVVFAILLPFLFVNMARKKIYEVSFGEFIQKRKLRLDLKRQFKHELAVAAIAKNEGKYIEEWIAYYIKMGVSKFYIYDNGSTDNLKNILAKYIENGIVEYIYFPGECQQIPAYKDAILRVKNTVRYLLVIDCDEFVECKNGQSILETICSVFKKNKCAAGIGINWRLFGSSGYDKEPKGALVTETFLYCAEEQEWPNRHIKTICNPRFVKNYISPHFPVYYLGCYNVNAQGKRIRLWYNKPVDCSSIQCNHYFCKSKEEFIKKRSRGMADRNAHYDMEKFTEYDKNQVYDDSMLVHSGDIKKIIHEFSVNMRK